MIIFSSLKVCKVTKQINKLPRPTVFGRDHHYQGSLNFMLKRMNLIVPFLKRENVTIEGVGKWSFEVLKQDRSFIR